LPLINDVFNIERIVVSMAGVIAYPFYFWGYVNCIPKQMLRRRANLVELSMRRYKKYQTQIWKRGRAKIWRCVSEIER
jgi:hypothetical protein